MEERRIREIATLIQQAFEQHRDGAADLRSFLEQRGVRGMDVMEALEDAERVDPDGTIVASGGDDEGVTSLLRLAADRLQAQPGQG